LNHTTEETGRFLGLGDGEAFCDFRDGDGEWRLSKAGTCLKDLSDVGVAGIRGGATTRVVITNGEGGGEDVALYLGGGTTVIWSATFPIKGGAVGEGVHVLRDIGAMRGIAEDGFGMVKVSMTGLEGPTT
jgi:hypothetical protein